jgi:hypothetical protein
MKQSLRAMRNLIDKKRFGISTATTVYPTLTCNSIKEELARLERNKERRHAREKAKAPRTSTVDASNAGSPSSVPAQSIEKPTGTTRKCANCGQTGHIKTNKKYCPNYQPPVSPRNAPRREKA